MTGHMEVDDQPLSVKLTQREQGPAICSKVNGKETRWGCRTCQHRPEGLEGADEALSAKESRMKVKGIKRVGTKDMEDHLRRWRDEGN